MIIVLDSIDIDEAMNLYLESKGFVSKETQTKIDYTKLRNGAGLSAEVIVVRDEQHTKERCEQQEEGDGPKQLELNLDATEREEDFKEEQSEDPAENLFGNS